MKTKLQILNETAAFYAADPAGRRATNDAGGCVYLTEDGRMCAVGRCLKVPGEIPELTMGIYQNWGRVSFSEEYTGHPVEFWGDLQAFHDDLSKTIWSEIGLTEHGQKELERLRELYA